MNKIWNEAMSTGPFRTGNRTVETKPVKRETFVTKKEESPNDEPETQVYPDTQEIVKRPAAKAVKLGKMKPTPKPKAEKRNEETPSGSAAPETATEVAAIKPEPRKQHKVSMSANLKHFSIFVTPLTNEHCFCLRMTQL